MADKLVDVPMINPANPKTPITVFFAIIAALAVLDFCFFKNTHVSIRAGNAKPSDDKHNAPNNDMNKSNLGIATASRTENTNIIIQMDFKEDNIIEYHFSEGNYTYK